MRSIHAFSHLDNGKLDLLDDGHGSGKQQQRKQITFRLLITIGHDLLSADIGKIDFNINTKNIDSIVDNYNTVFTYLLD